MRKFAAVYCNTDDDVPPVSGPTCLPVYSSSWLIAGSNNEIVSRRWGVPGSDEGGEKVKWVDRSCSGEGVIKSEGSDKSSHSELVLPNVYKAF